MIPKIIHYCWFGGKEIPERVKKYMETWKILEEAGYEIIRWDESNCDFTENEFVKFAYENKKWGFIGDYYRLKCLYDHGGIYLDTDVIVSKTFDDLLDNKAFIGFLYDCMLETAVIGAEKGSKYIASIMEMYETSKFSDYNSVVLGKPEKNVYDGKLWIPSNEFYSWRTIKEYPELKFNNKMQIFNDFTLYPDYCFDRGKVFGKEYCMHMYTGAWDGDFGLEGKIKFFFKNNIFTRKIITIRRIIKKRQQQKGISFYKYKMELKGKK